MLILGRDVLDRVSRRNALLRKWLEVWTVIVDWRTWGGIEEVRVDYPSADGVKLKSGLVITVFNVKGNTYRLLTRIDCDSGIVELLDVLTHAEYDKNAWKERY